MESFEAVIRTAELGPGQLREVQARGATLAVANVGQTYYALAAECPVDGTNLARDGRLSGDCLVCPNDGTRFHLATGEAVEGEEQLRSYQIRVSANQVQVGDARAP